MADSAAVSGIDREPWPEIDTGVAHVARVYDYLLGGKANFAVDRQAAERAYQTWPGGIDGVRADVRAHRALLGRVVTYLVGEGIRQFLDIGTGIPTENNTHQVAQRLAPEARIVYVDHDPIVLAHSHKLLTSTPEGVTAYIFGDLRDPGPVLDKAAETLDFTRPIAVMLFGVLHFFAPEEHPEQTIATLLGSLVPGSYLALTHLAGDVYGDQMAQTFRELSQRMNQNVYLRSQDEVRQLYASFCRKRPSPLPELPVQYADFASWQRKWFQGEKLEAQIAYWKDALAGASPVLALPTDKPRPRERGENQR